MLLKQLKGQNKPSDRPDSLHIQDVGSCQDNPYLQPVCKCSDMKQGFVIVITYSFSQ